MFVIDDIAVAAAGEIATEVAAETVTEIAAETATEVASEAIQEATTEVATEAVSETAPEIVPETATEVGTEIVSETAGEIVPETATEVGTDVVPEDPETKTEVPSYKEGIIQNKEEGLRRESEVEQELEDKYPESEGNKIISEAYLRDSEGKIVRDKETGEARRIDFVVVKDGQVIDSVEVTSETADKTFQSAKEDRIRESGGNFIKTEDGTLVKYLENLKTRIERRV